MNADASVAAGSNPSKRLPRPAAATETQITDREGWRPAERPFRGRGFVEVRLVLNQHVRKIDQVLNPMVEPADIRLRRHDQQARAAKEMTLDGAEDPGPHGLPHENGPDIGDFVDESRLLP